ncbi:MAG: hypothetical protein FJW14_14340 [Acidimicrobiia bacterium]|nr:hypothetical protein [Acidimicrobiia bacterium]
MTREAIDRTLQRTVTSEELRHALHAPVARQEREEVLALVRWFTARYPAPEDRLAYVRQAYARWRTHMAHR